MEIAKTIHIICAYATGLGFLIRGILAVMQSTVLQAKPVKILPHIIDAFLLISGIFLAVSLSLMPSENTWLIAKVVALFVYIGFGLVMLRFGFGGVPTFLSYSPKNWALWLASFAGSRSMVSIWLRPCQRSTTRYSLFLFRFPSSSPGLRGCKYSFLLSTQ